MSEEEREPGQGDEASSIAKTYTCRYCGEGPFTLPELGTHSKTCPERLKAMAEAKKEAGGEGVEPPEGSEARQIVAQFGREGLNKLKKERLRSVLDMAPGVGNKTIPWILHKWDVNARLRDDPMEFWRMLHDDAGLKPNTATSIVRDVFSLEEEFADLLYQRGEQPIFFRPAGYGYGAPPAGIGWGYGQPAPTPGTPSYWPTTPTTPGMPTPTGYPPMAGPFLTRDEYIKMQRDQEEKSRMDKMEERINKLDRDFAGALTGMKEEIFGKMDEVLKPKEEKVVLPLLDEKGAPIVDSKTGEARTVTVPTSMALFVMMGMRRGLTEEEIRKVVKEESQPPRVEETEAYKGLKSRLDDAVAKYDELKEKMEAEDRKRLEDTIKDLRSRMDTLLSRPAGEYKADEYRFMADALNRLTDVLEGRKPMETVKEIFVPGGVTAKPPSEKAGEAERGGVLEELGKKGLVVRVVERLRR